MNATAFALSTTTNLWDVFLLFAVPIGGGIPAGVVLAQKYGIGWVTMMWLYLISDIALAIVFEPLMIVFIKACHNHPKLAHLRAVFKQSMQKVISGYGPKPGPFLLIVIAFGVDPMTGRAAAMAQGHGFITGWIVAIIGDMFFFTVVMASTIWLNNILGDGTTTAIIIFIAMMAIPALIRKIKSSSSGTPARS